MATTEQQTPGRATVAQRWQARLALVAAAAAVLVAPVVGGFGTGVALLLVGLAGLALTAAGVWWALTNRGLVSWLAVALAVVALLVVLVLYTSRGLLWVVLVAIGLLVLAVVAGRAALRGDPTPEKMREHDVPPPSRPYLIMNPRSGGGKVTRFGLKDKAEALGATVALLEGPGTVDVGALARQAVVNGADLLGVAGGDGTQALVAGIAAEHDLPLLVISAGTRNHFALDLGLDREDPSRCLDALRDGVELRIDLGVIGDRPFVNNASFGAYAAIVQSPAYRDDKAGTTTEMLPDLLVGHSGPRLVARAGNVTVEGPQAVLVSNNVYGTDDIAGLGRRARLDSGTLGMLAVTVNNAVQAAGLLRGRNSRGLTRLAGREVVVDADTAQIPVGVDGEALQLDTPVRCTVRPAALRVRVPRDRPGFPTAGHLASWAGRCPGNNLTGGKRRSGKPSKGNRWLGEVLIECAWAAARSRDTYLSAQYWRLARRIGKKKAAVAVGHSILVIAWHLLTDNCDYQDLGSDYFARRDTDRQRQRAVAQLQALGYHVALEPVAA